MNKLNKLEALARAVQSLNASYDDHLRYQDCATAETILCMIEVMREMAGALEYYDFGNGVPQKALARYKEIAE